VESYTLKNIIIFIIQILLFFTASLIWVNNNNILILIYSTLVCFLLSFYIINNNNLSKNIINPSSIFFMGFGLFFLGRFFSVIFDANLVDEVFCLDFIFNYCENGFGIFYINLVINLIMIFYIMPFLLLRKKNCKSHIYIEKINFNKIKTIFLITLIGLFFLINSSVDSISEAISKGYLAIYAAQAERYQPPYFLIVNSIVYSGLAVLFLVKKDIPKYYFYLPFFIFIIFLMLGVLTGSRSSFVTAIIILAWIFIGDKKISKISYLLIFILGLGLIYSINFLATLSGAREIGVNGSILNNIANTLFGQGITMMVFNSSINVDNYPFLGGLKVIFPGIQILFPIFDYNNRYEFDWSSYMTFNENKSAYLDGFGLGWSVFSDFYVFSMGVIPIFCFLVFLLSRFIIYVMHANSNYKKGLIFIFMISLFSLSRESLSSLFFTIIIFTVICLFIGVLRLKRL